MLLDFGRKSTLDVMPGAAVLRWVEDSRNNPVNSNMDLKNT